MTNSVLWVGESGHWNVPPPDVRRYAMPLVEEEVLPVAFSDEFAGLIRLSREAAIRCTSRLAQRVALAHTGLNPEWEPIRLTSGVIKRAASCHNNGVTFLPETEHADLLASYVPELQDWGVHEQFLGGSAYELDGVVVGGKMFYFQALEQIWDAGKTKIESYRPTGIAGIQHAALTAVRAVGLDNAPFCCEFRFHRSQWKVIEVHARLGEDAGLAQMMSAEYPLDVINKAAE